MEVDWGEGVTPPSRRMVKFAYSKGGESGLILRFFSRDFGGYFQYMINRRGEGNHLECRWHMLEKKNLRITSQRFLPACDKCGSKSGDFPQRANQGSRISATNVAELEL